MTATMRAVYLVGERKLDIREIPVPAVPEDGLILDVKACDLLETPLADGTRCRQLSPHAVEVTLKPFEIVTLLLQH